MVPLAGLTNRQWRLSVGAEQAVLRLAAPAEALGVDRQAERRAWQWAAGQGISPALLWQQGPWTLSQYIPQTAPPARAQQLKALLGHIHRLQLARLTLPVLDLPGRARALGQEPGPVAAYRFIQESPLPLVPAHVDPSEGNCLWQQGRLWLIDWEYASLADPYYDLAGLLVAQGFEPLRLVDAWATLTGHRLNLKRLLAMEAVYAHLCELWCQAAHPSLASGYRVHWQARLAQFNRAI